MQLFLVNYDTHYEIEQLSRMFFRGLTVTKTDSLPQLPEDEYILIENKGGAFSLAVCTGKGCVQDEITILLLISRRPLENLKCSFRCKNASFRICLGKAKVSKVVRRSEHLIKEDHRLVRKYMAIY